MGLKRKLGTNMGSKKLLLIGWDAADWQMIDPLIAEGKMPTLKRLIDNGVSGSIATLNPILSPMLWTSIATGKRAYDHGVLGFVEADAASGNITPVKGSSRKVKTAWNILNEAGLKTNVVNWWPSHPAEVLNGSMVSNRYHEGAKPTTEEWQLDENTVYPNELYEMLKELRVHPTELTLAHVLPFIPNANKLDPEKDKILKSLIRVLAHTSSIHNAATHLMEETAWDFMAVYSESIDHFSHLAMKYHPPKIEGVNDHEFELYKEIMSSAYRFHDMLLERYLDLAGPDCNVVLVSDHGFQSGKQRVLELPDVPAAPALEHRKYGVFVASGPDFKKGEKVYGASLLDITPTILHQFGLPTGEDMEGKVLHSIFVEDKPVGVIPSWEMTEARPQFLEENSSANEAILNQLDELGYIDLNTEDKLTYVRQERAFNLAQSYVDGNKFEEAKACYQELFDELKDLRSTIGLADTLIKLGHFEDFNSLMAQLDKKVQDHPYLIFLIGSAKLYQGKPKEALADYLVLEDLQVNSAQLFNEIGNAFLLSGDIKASQNYFGRSLNLDHENAAALSGKGQCLTELGQYEEALPILEKSLALTYYQPNVHYLMAQCFYKLSHIEAAKSALLICIQQAPRHLKAIKLYQEINGGRQASKPVIVVTGFPRSGTSLVMNMLQQSGLELLIDGKREKDTHNPKGYFEYEKVKALGKDGSWMKNGQSKVLKVVSPLLRYLPASETYKLIWVKRPLTEVITSQEVMKGRKKEEVMANFPFQLAVDLQAEEKRLLQWIGQQPNIELLEVDYYQCITNPSAVLSGISSFLGIELDEDNGVLAVDAKLHRNKLGDY